MQSLVAAMVAVVAATVHTGDGPPLKDATLLVENGRVLAVGGDSKIPSEARMISGAGLVVTPGFVDAASRVGLTEVDQEASGVEGSAGPEGDPVRAALRVADTFNPAGQAIEVARGGGLTALVVIPRDGVVAGQSIWVSLGDEAAVAATTTALHVSLGAAGRVRGSRSRAFMTLRRALEDARVYRVNTAAYRQRQLRDLAPSSADLAVLARTLGGELPVVFEVDRAADIRTALSIAAEYELRVVLLGAAEGWRVAEQIAAAQVPVLVNPFENLPADFDSLQSRADNAALLHAAGVRVAFTLRGEAHQAARLRQAAGVAVANGFPYDAAIAALTRLPAEIFDRERSGTLRPGQRADFVVWNGDPFELDTWPLHVFVAGDPVDLRGRQDELTERYGGSPR